jgi:LCP family protein required for cell wall assembly
MRNKRARKRKILMGVTITLVSVVIASLVAVAAYAVIIGNKFGTDLQGNLTDFDSGAWEGVFVEPEKPEDPFWMLLMGTDERYDGEIPRTDTLILVYVDQANKTASMISIPRDTYVSIEGYGYNKINAAYTFGELDEPGSGTALAIKTVSDFAGVDIAYFAQVNFNGFKELVDGLGGVEVDVLFDIIGSDLVGPYSPDLEADGLSVYAGLQTLDGEHAFSFIQSRSYPNGDYQRQANQRVFLQALAKKVLSSDPATIATTVTTLAEMTHTNMNLATIIKVAQGMRGLQEDGIHTYTVPSTTDMIDDISYVVADSYAWRELINAINAGEYPEHQDESIAGVVPDDYIAGLTPTTTDLLAGQASNVNPSDYLIDVRNGNGIAGSAQSVSDMLYIAGYRQGELGNTDAYVYEKTLIIYNTDANKVVAEDIRKRLGYGKTIDSLGRYTFAGDILVVVGDDFVQQ